MGARQREWARRKRDELYSLLGNVCNKCGATENLTLDCKIPCGPDHQRRMEWSARMSFYTRQYEQGNLALKCNKCNGTKSDGLELTGEPKADIPF